MGEARLGGFRISVRWSRNGGGQITSFLALLLDLLSPFLLSGLLIVPHFRRRPTISGQTEEETKGGEQNWFVMTNSEFSRQNLIMTRSQSTSRSIRLKPRIPANGQNSSVGWCVRCNLSTIDFTCKLISFSVYKKNAGVCLLPCHVILRHNEKTAKKSEIESRDSVLGFPLTARSCCDKSNLRPSLDRQMMQSKSTSRKSELLSEL